jgi:hypothetical protein
MKNQLLLPRQCRILGIILLLPSVALFIAYFNYNFELSFLATTPPLKSDLLGGNNNLTDEFAIAGVIISLFMIAFSKLRHEDEYTRFVRLQSLQVGVYVNYAIFILLTFTVYGGNYLSVLFYNIATILILFILMFNFNMYIKPRFSKSLTA